jgi:ceramide glucosyltransferase
VPVVNRLIAAHPDVRARLIIGKDRISPNPKLNNIVKGWRAAAHDWIVIADSNVLMPRDYIQRLSATWQPDTGLVCSPPVGCLPDGVFAELECAFLNTYQARWQCVADSAGYGFAQGKSMLWRRDLLERAGGIRAFGQRARRGRSIDQGGSQSWPARAHRRPPVPAATRAPYGQRSVAPAAALGAAAA